MDPPKPKWPARTTACVAAIVAGLSVILAAALALDVREPEPSGSVVLLVLGTAAVVAIFMGRATYRGVLGLLGGTLNTRI